MALPGKHQLAAAGLLLAGSALAAEDCQSPDIGLALGSGGAGGLAHIAMLAEFEALDLRPAALAGTSIGAIVATLHAGGLDSSEIRELFEDFGDSAMNPFQGDQGLPGWRDLIDLQLGNGGVLDPDGFLDLVDERMTARRFSDIDRPLLIVATDYWSGEAHVFDSGELRTALRASMAVPGLFAPVSLDDKLLIDGGASNPLPFDVLGEVDRVVAIDVTGTRSRQPDDPPGITDLLFKTFEIMQQSIVRARVEADPPDLLIRPALEEVRLLHFDRVDTVIEQAGSAAAELRQALKEYADCQTDD